MTLAKIVEVMTSRSLHCVLLSAVVACVQPCRFLPQPEEVLRYAGKAEIAAPVGHSCYPDMAGVVDIVLLLMHTSGTSRGYLMVNPGFAVEIERKDSGEAWTICNPACRRVTHAIFFANAGPHDRH